jgi:ATP-binding cassette subfamily A (ABC1) protein 3
VVGDIYPKTDPLILFITLFMYSLATICFNFAQSTLLSNPNLSVALGIILHFGTWVPAVLITPENYFTWSAGIKMAIAIVPNMGSTLSFLIITMKEDQPGGMGWSALNTPINASDNLSLLDIWLSNLISCAIFLTILWYMDNVRPGKFGVARPLWFPLQRSYWCGHSVARANSAGMSAVRDPKMFEVEPSQEKGVEVNGLKKVFKGRKAVVAVDNVTFNAYKGEITALLGHNGAGKTTTMSMLTGLFSPTAGTAKVNGWDLGSQLEEARERMGLCPQHNMLFPRSVFLFLLQTLMLLLSLSVIEHLIFFGMLKGISYREANKEGDFFIKRLNLADKKHQPSTAL